MRGILRGLIVAVMALLMLCVAGTAVAKEAGLITNVTGNVYYGAEKEKAAAFMKAKIDDVFYLEEGAAMDIVYFKNGRKEKWKGLVEIEIGEEMGKTATANQPAVSKTDSPAEGLRAIPKFLAELNTEIMGGKVERSGGTGEKVVAYRKFSDLSDEEKQSVSAAKKVYMDMLKTAEPDDITPELFSIGMLSQYKLYLETLGLVNIALKKQPDHDGLKLVKAGLEKIIKDAEGS